MTDFGNSVLIRRTDCADRQFSQRTRARHCQTQLSGSVSHTNVYAGILVTFMVQNKYAGFWYGLPIRVHDVQCASRKCHHVNSQAHAD